MILGVRGLPRPRHHDRSPLSPRSCATTSNHNTVSAAHPLEVLMVPMTRLNTRRSPLGVVLTLLAGLIALPAAAHAQGAVITGRVQSEMGQPLEAANVFITEMNL